MKTFWNTEEIHEASKKICEMLFFKISHANMENSIKEFGLDNHEEIECFEEMLFPFTVVFFRSNFYNMEEIKSLPLQNLSQASRIFWLHFASTVILRVEVNEPLTEVILKFINLAIA